MSEQKKPSFMEELDKWTMANVIHPLIDSFAKGDEEGRREIDRIKIAIRQKVLESYRNGQGARPAAPKGGRHGR